MLSSEFWYVGHIPVLTENKPTLMLYSPDKRPKLADKQTGEETVSLCEVQTLTYIQVSTHNLTSPCRKVESLMLSQEPRQPVATRNAALERAKTAGRVM